MDIYDGGTKKDHGTKRKTPFQVQTLGKFYLENQYPTHEAMDSYAASLGLTYKQVRTWFIERRRKERRENEVSSGNQSLPADKVILTRSKANEKTALSHSKGKTPYKSKFYGNQHSKPSKDGRLLVNSRPARQTDRSHKGCIYISSTQRETSDRVCGIMSAQLKRKYCAAFSQNRHIDQQKSLVRPQVLLSKDYIMQRVFRKDGPPLGVEFAPLPKNAFSHDTGFGNLYSYQEGPIILKRIKALESPSVEPGTLIRRDTPVKKHGVGKGLMTVWRATTSKNGKLPVGINFVGESSAWMPKTFFKEKPCRTSKGMQQLPLVLKQSIFRKKLPEKRKPPLKTRKVSYGKVLNQKKPHCSVCKLSVVEINSLEQSNALMQLVDDEELELRELQAGPNPLRCSAHLSSNGRHGCPFCKDMLAKFPPQPVKMKQPFCTRPWDSSPELVKKLFKVFKFLYSNSAAIEICPFTLDEFSHAFSDKDSMLLGKINVALLKLLLLDVERDTAAGLIPRATKDGRFLGFLHFVREQELDVKFWSQSLNPLTWIEILRQVLVAAGFGTKPNTARREIFNKERNHMSKYGLLPRTLKGELFSMLSEQGSGGLKVTELAKASQIVALDLPNSTEELEELVCLTLSSDVTLFEKIAPFAYRLRVNPDIKGKEGYQSDGEDSGGVDDESGDTSSSSSSTDDSEELNSARREKRIVKYEGRHKRTGQKLTEYTEIDESYSGEAWVLGLMEGEYANLSIDEKLDALIALVDLVGAGSSLGMEEPVRAMSTVIPTLQYHGSGAKIKKSMTNSHLMSQSLWKTHGVAEEQNSPTSFLVDSSAIVPDTSKKGHCSKTKSSKPTEASQPTVHPLLSIFLGSDRRYNSYWLFLGPCDATDPGHRRVYFESSDDGHWETIDTSEALDALLSALDCRGRREACLFASLDKRKAFLCQAMDDYITVEYKNRQRRGSDPAELDTNSGDGSSPISDVDNILAPLESLNCHMGASGAINFERRKNSEEMNQKWDRMQEFDKWIWNSFYSSLNAVKKSKRSYLESLARCESCHDLYWRDEKHCRICHTTFELDFDLEERYAIHVATCRGTEDSCNFPKHKVLPSQLQALKAAIHAIEAGMPEVALSVAWTRSTHKLWVTRLRRTSSLPEFLQVLADFVGAINEEWLYECAFALGPNSALDEIIVYFQTMPQTTSAVALWMVKLDTLLAPYLEKLQPEQTVGSRPQLKRRLCLH